MKESQAPAKQMSSDRRKQEDLPGQREGERELDGNRAERDRKVCSGRSKDRVGAANRRGVEHETKAGEQEKGEQEL